MDNKIYKKLCARAAEEEDLDILELLQNRMLALLSHADTRLTTPPSPGGKRGCYRK
jgi:hypothetical protein